MARASREAWETPVQVPTLVELCSFPVAMQLGQHSQLSEVPSKLQQLLPSVRARVLKHALSADSFDEEWLRVFPETQLSLSGSRLSDRGLEIVALARGSCLLEIDLSRCVYLHDSGLRALVHACGSLRKLDVSYCRLSDAAFECTARCCPKLIDLNYAWNGSGVGDGAAGALATHCGHLERLEMSGSRVCDSALLSLACACPKLQHLQARPPRTVAGCERHAHLLQGRRYAGDERQEMRCGRYEARDTRQEIRGRR